VRTVYLPVLVVGLLATAARASHGQFAGAFDVGSGIGKSTDNVWLRESQFAPMLRAASRHGYLMFDGALVERGGSVSLRRSSLDAAISTQPFGIFRLTSAGKYTRDLSAPASFRSSASVSGALSVKVGRGGVWTGAARGSGSFLQLHAGVWRVFNDAIITLSSQSHFMRSGGRPSTIQVVTFTDSVYSDSLGGWSYFESQRIYGDSGSASRLARFSDLEARVDWAVGRIMLMAAVSGRGPVDSTPAMAWGRMHAAIRVKSGVSLVAGVGTQPIASSVKARSSRFASLGVRLSPVELLRSPQPAAVRPSATGFTIRPAAPGTYTVTFRVPHARTVELSGDFNHWSPIALRQAAPNLWEASIALARGTHRISVRVDGDSWTAVPGLAAVDDEFSGRVSLLVIR
jgi:hypothetical protein